MKKYFTAAFLLILSMGVFAQDTNYVDQNYQGKKEKSAGEKSSFRKSTYFGGTFGLTFGSYTSILLEPMVGFKLTEKLSTGVGIGIRYGKYTNGPEFTNYIGRVFTRYRLFERVYAHAEYMLENYDVDIIERDKRVTVPYLFVGGGLSQPAGPNSWFIVQVLVNVIQSEYSQDTYPSSYPYISLGYIGNF